MDASFFYLLNITPRDKKEVCKMASGLNEFKFNQVSYHKLQYHVFGL